jgi:hypothetical protein
MKVVIKVMRRGDETSKAKENGSNKLRIDYISGGKSLTFWSRIAPRRIHQPSCIIYLST